MAVTDTSTLSANDMLHRNLKIPSMKLISSPRIKLDDIDTVDYPRTIPSLDMNEMPKDRGSQLLKKPDKKKTKSFATTVEYFGDDEGDEINRIALKNLYFYYESEVNFSIGQYVEYFVYHMIFFLLMGPFIVVLGLFSRRLKYIFANIAFTTFNISAVLQTLYWLSTITTVTGYLIMNVYQDNKWPGIDYVLIKACVISMIIRTTSIAGKYATYPKKLL